MQAIPEILNEAVGLPQGLFTSKGNEWKRSRLAVAPAFSARNMRMVSYLAVCVITLYIKPNRWLVILSRLVRS